MQKYYYGCIYTGESKYIKVLLNGNPQNLASFIFKCPSNKKVKITTLDNIPMIECIGSIIHYFDLDIRDKIITNLVLLRMKTIKPNIIEFLYDKKFEKMFHYSKAKYVEWIKDTTGYSLI